VEIREKRTLITPAPFDDYLKGDKAALGAQAKQGLDKFMSYGCSGCIDDPKAFDILALKRKSVSIHWEFMFTRAVFETADMTAQHRLLKKIAEMVDAGSIRTTLSGEFGPINAANLKRAHALIESGRATGKVVLSGF
jgi:NADPH:quinone reductase-like Zn-dependent oxidoreductase